MFFGNSHQKVQYKASPKCSFLGYAVLFKKKITLQVAGLDKTVSAQQCIDYLNEKAGEVKYFRFCTRAGDPVKYALAEFSDRAAVINALKLNGQVGR